MTGLVDRRRECDVLDGLLEAARAGRGGVVVVRGEAGIGKTALLDHVAAAASDLHVVRASGVESELELAFAVLHQLCAPLLDRLPRLPEPQRAALGTAFGLRSGPAPDQFLVGLALLSLLSEASGGRPLLCIVDDGHWLDRASSRALAFAARRLVAEPVLLLIAAREPGDDLRGLPDLAVDGLPDEHARELLASVVRRPLDRMVRERVLGEARGNPLALLELPRDSSAEDLWAPAESSVAGRVQETFRRRIDRLPAGTRLLLRVAAADPVGDPARVWLAARRLGVPAEAATPAEGDGLVEFATWVRFRHPLIRSAAYGGATLAERQQVHRALSEATDPEADPDRHAWHRAQAAPGPDEEVAAALARSAARAQARGGLAAAAAFRHRAAMLTPDPAGRARRLLDAARANWAAGALRTALELLTAADAGPPEESRAAEAQHVRGQIMLEQRRGREAVELLLGAARRLGPFDTGLARDALVQALGAALWTGESQRPGILRDVTAAVRAAPPPPAPPRAADVLLDALTTRLAEGHTAAAPALRNAQRSILALRPGVDLEIGPFLWMVGYRAGGIVAGELWDDNAWHTLARRQVEVARGAGALAQLQFALNYCAWTHIESGELSAAAHLLDEDRLIGEAIGTGPVGYCSLTLAAWRGDEGTALPLIERTTQLAAAQGMGRFRTLADHASTVLFNGLGRHAAARDAARRAFERDELGYDTFLIPELAEAASRTGDAELVTAVLDRMSERAAATGTEWALGTEACLRGLAGHGDDAFREAIDRLSRTRRRAQLARVHLLYGEWLRRERKRAEARRHLRRAYEMLAAMGVDGFAERARRELLATGETVRKRAADEAVAELTAQEAQIARLAREGLSNPEISTRLFISPRTVEWHLGNVFVKLGISSRRQLRGVLPAPTARALGI